MLTCNWVHDPMIAGQPIAYGHGWSYIVYRVVYRLSSIVYRVSCHISCHRVVYRIDTIVYLQTKGQAAKL
jgi:hypothetical protein